MSIEIVEEAGASSRRHRFLRLTSEMWRVETIVDDNTPDERAIDQRDYFRYDLAMEDFSHRREHGAAKPAELG